MRKVMMIFALMFLVLGIMLHSPLVFAESNDSNTGNTGTSCTDSDGGKNIYEKGVVEGYKIKVGVEIVTKNEVMIVEDACYLSSGSNLEGLTEYFCNEGVINSQNIDCNCGEGVCIDGTGNRSIDVETEDTDKRTVNTGDDEETTDTDKRTVNTGDDEETTDTDKEDDSKPNLISGRTKTESKSVIIDDNGCKIKIEKKVEIQKGKRVEVIKKKMECPDGRKAEVQFKRENRTVNGVTKERIRYEVEGEDSIEVEIEDELEVEEEMDGTEYKLKAKLRDGRESQIKIMPDRASEIAIARLKSLNFTVELREVGNGNETRVAYFAGADKRGKFLGVFKTKVNVETEIDSETGEVLNVGKPWWAFLVSGEDSNQIELNDVDPDALIYEVDENGTIVNNTNTTTDDSTADTALTESEDEDGVLDVNESDIAA